MTFQTPLRHCRKGQRPCLHLRVTDQENDAVLRRVFDATASESKLVLLCGWCERLPAAGDRRRYVGDLQQCRADDSRHDAPKDERGYMNDRDERSFDQKICTDGRDQHST